MPAIITHDQFAHEMLERVPSSLIRTASQRDAFTLGSQGPDPLFFCAISPTLAKYRSIGSLMHDEKPAELICELWNSVDSVPTISKDIIRAFSAGFLCHYLLDRSAHPFVYAQQYALCDAGIEGLDRRDGHEVHAVIESELDEMILYTHRSLTVGSFKPYRNILKINEQALSAISYAVSVATKKAFKKQIPTNLFAKSVHNYRLAQWATYSPHGVKRALYGKVERLVRRHSFAQAFCHRPIPLTTSAFDNHGNEEWIDPFTGERHTTSFEDIFMRVLGEANEQIARFMRAPLCLEEVKMLCKGLNYSGKPLH